jgi:tetratricopeptide (TPR) repeat protein
MAVMLVALVQSGRETQRQRDYASGRAEHSRRLIGGLLSKVMDPLRLNVNTPQPRPLPNDPYVTKVAEIETLAAAMGSFPEEQWFMLLIAGSNYRNVSMFDAADRCLTASLDLARGYVPSDPDAPYQEAYTADYMIARSAYDLGRLRFWMGDLDGAAPLLVESRDLSLRQKGPTSDLAFMAAMDLAQVDIRRDRLEEAEAELRALRALEWSDADRICALQAQQALGRLCLDERRYDEAGELLLPLLDQAQNVYTRVDWLNLGGVVARLHDERGRLAREEGRTEDADAADEQAEQLFKAIRQGLDAVRPAAEAQLSDVLACYGSFLTKRIRLAEASDVLEQALQVALLAVGEDAFVTLQARNNLAVALYRSEHREEAEALWRENLESDRRTPLPDRRPADTALKNLATLCANTERLTEAQALATELLARTRSKDTDYPSRCKLLDDIKGKIAKSTDNP